MKHLYTFKIFESEVWDRLDELQFSQHWKERTSSGGIEGTRDSRVLPRNPNVPHGFTIEYLTDKKGMRYELEDILPQFGDVSEADVLSLVSSALNRMTRGAQLIEWEPKPDDRYVYLLDFGKLALAGGDKEYFVHLAAGNPNAKGDMIDKWETGDNIWGFADHRKEELQAMTLKFYPSTEEGLSMAKRAAMRDAGMGVADFYGSSRVEFPYGKNFVLLLDLSDTSARGRVDKIKDQLAGGNIILGPSGKEYISTIEEPPTRKTITPGDKIGLVVKYADPDNPIMGTVTSILNMNDIKDAQKMKSLGTIQEIKVSFLPSDPQHVKVGSNGQPLQITIKIIGGTKIVIDGEEYKVLGEGGGKPLVTSEPSIIDKGSVQTWVKKS